MAPKKQKKSKRKRSSSESSTPSEDEKQQLFPGGACGYSGSHEFRSVEKTKSTSPGKLSPDPCLGETSKNAPKSASSSKTNPLVSESSKPSSGKLFPNFREGLQKYWLPKKSPKRSSGPKCSCKDEKNHDPNCSELNVVEYSEHKPTKTGSNDIEPPSCNTSPIILKKDCTQSSSSSDPSVSEYSRNETKSENDPLSTALTESSSSSHSKSPAEIRKKPLTLKKSPNRSSDTKCRCEDQINHHLECIERWKETGARPKSMKGKSQSKSESSSSSSGILKRGNHSDASNISSETSQASNSKSSNISDHKATRLRSDKGNKSSGKSASFADSSIAKMDQDPLEGSSSGPVRSKSNRKHSSDDMETNEDANSTGLVSEKRHDLKIGAPANRSKSFKSCLRAFQSERARFPSPDYNLTELRAQLEQIGRDLSQEMANAEGDSAEDYRNEIDQGLVRQLEVVGHAPAVERVPNEIEQGLLRQVAVVRPAAAVRRHQSASPVRPRDCNCGTGDQIGAHKIHCSKFIDARLRRKRRRCKQSAFRE